METMISSATQRNWDKLSVNIDNKLKSRANKQKSTKRIIPFEYLLDNEKIELIKQIIELHSINRIPDIIYHTAKVMLQNENIHERQSVREILLSFQTEHRVKRLQFKERIPKFNREEDFLGALYQALLSEGEKNVRGSYYTPFEIVDDMLSGFDLGDSLNFLDPCCGSYVIIVLVVKSLIKSRVLVLLQKIKTLKINNLCVV